MSATLEDVTSGAREIAADPTRPAGLALSHIWVALITFVLASFMGFYQVLERAELIPALTSDAGYYTSVTSHGVIMAYVFTTFFIVGIGYYMACTSLNAPVWNRPLAWLGFLMMLVGTTMAALAMFTGNASVLYTFYPPLTAHWAFYIGTALLLIGSLAWVLIMVVMSVQWKRSHPGQALPLAMFGITANAVLWFFTMLGVAAEVVFQLIPLALGWVETVDAGLARTLFAWTLHPIVYFWLIPAYIAMYTFMPKVAGGRLISDEMARVAFIMLLVFGLPIGFHHLYMDPQQAAGWKLFHGFGTFLVAVPTLITGFTVIASMEIAGRLRGGKGLFGWIAALPWREPMVLAGGLALLMLTLGGFGGVVNASYALNVVVHNTMWVPAHFHLIFAGTTVIMYFAIAYYLWPSMTGKILYSIPMARQQLWLWFLGIVLVTVPWHILGLLGQPRRTAQLPYDDQFTASWGIYELIMVIGAAVMAYSAVLFAYNLLKSHGARQPVAASREVGYAEAVHPPLALPKPLNGFALWSWIIVVYMIVSFGYPILQFFVLQTHDPGPWGW